MKKSILKLGRALIKADQKLISGGSNQDKNCTRRFGVGAFYVDNCSECRQSNGSTILTGCISNCCFFAY